MKLQPMHRETLSVAHPIPLDYLTPMRPNLDQSGLIGEPYKLLPILLEPNDHQIL